MTEPSTTLVTVVSAASLRVNSAVDQNEVTLRQKHGTCKEWGVGAHRARQPRRRRAAALAGPMLRGMLRQAHSRWPSLLPGRVQGNGWAPEHLHVPPHSEHGQPINAKHWPSTCGRVLATGRLQPHVPAWSSSNHCNNGAATTAWHASFHCCMFCRCWKHACVDAILYPGKRDSRLGSTSGVCDEHSSTNTMSQRSPEHDMSQLLKEQAGGEVAVAAPFLTSHKRVRDMSDIVALTHPPTNPALHGLSV